MKRLIICAAGVLPFLSMTDVATGEPTIGVAVDLSGPDSFQGDQILLGAELAVEVVNGGGGVLDQPLAIISVDDGCDPEQAVAAAAYMVDERVDVVIGHLCSGASIAAAPIYEEAGIVMISPSSTNPRLTDDGRANVFRVIGRDDHQGEIGARYLLAEHGRSRIAILHDGTAYGQGLAVETKEELNRLGVEEILFGEYDPTSTDYESLTEQLAADAIEVLYVGGDAPEAALILRQAKEAGIDLQLISGDALATEEFWLVSGEVGEGTRFTFAPDPRGNPSAKEIVERFREEGMEPLGYTLHSFAAVQAWAQAAEAAGSAEVDDVTAALKQGTFDTVLGAIGFDDRGDVEGTESFVWYEWRDGEYVQMSSEEVN
ncbi:MAG: branched-chain amino acid ABC transporter substrate-binding protein [Pseudomonadota bacterium]